MIDLANDFLIISDLLGGIQVKFQGFGDEFAISLRWLCPWMIQRRQEQAATARDEYRL